MGNFRKEKKVALVRILVVVLLSVGLFGGCQIMEERSRTIIQTRRQSESAGLIGCPPGEIVIVDDATVTSNNPIFKSDNWIALCRGHRFVCGLYGRPDDLRSQCKEELPPQAEQGGPMGAWDLGSNGKNSNEKTGVAPNTSKQAPNSKLPKN